MSNAAAKAGVQSLARALSLAADDVFSFVVVCTGGMQVLAETIIQEVFLLALERSWFTEDFRGNLSHDEHRLDLFREAWLASVQHQAAPKIGVDVPIGHEQMEFYLLSQRARAALFLRSKRKLPYDSIASILGISHQEAREEVELSRRKLLGRAPKEFEEEVF